MAVGGDLIEVSYDHPTLGSGILYPKSGEANTFKLGGYRVNNDANGVDGGNNMIKVMNNTRWEASFTPSWDMSSSRFEDVAAMAASTVDATWTLTHISGTVWTGEGCPVDDPEGAGGDGTFSLTISGGGGLKKVQ